MTDLDIDLRTGSGTVDASYWLLQNQTSLKTKSKKQKNMDLGSAWRSKKKKDD